MDASLISQMKAMEDENRRLKRMYADLSMQANLLEALGKSDWAISTPRDGRECRVTTWGKHRPRLPSLRGQRDLLLLWPEAAGRERRDRRSAGRADGCPQDLGFWAVFPAPSQPEGLGIEIDFSLPAERVICSLDKIIEWRGKPGTIRVDNGTGYISGKLLIWAEKRSITIQPGQPRQNAYIERYNRTVRHEWLDRYIIETID